MVFVSGLLFIPQPEAQNARTVILATTTSVQDAGLLDVLTERFNKKGEYVLKPIAVGSGQAMQLGRLAEADILLVHSPDDEELFMKNGYGLKRTLLMHNEFVLAGPPNDPGKVKDLEDISAAFKKICSSRSVFVSRGDNSGTHKMELSIWKTAGCKPAAGYYFETGQGMGQTVRVADQRRGYCLLDRATYLTLQKTLHLAILSAGDARLKNVYSLILVSPRLSAKVNVSGAKAFYDFMLSGEVKKIINNHKIDAFGQQLFFTEMDGGNGAH
ncbi:MAG: ABC transporter substrate-binding protein [Candidatus Latescibacterota bacterium]